MITLNILTNNKAPNSRAFNTPLLVLKPLLLEKGLKLRFHSGISDRIFNSDILFINSYFFRPFWRKEKDKIFTFLYNARKSGQKVIWFDTTDSTWSTQLEVLPFVDAYLKNQIYADKNLYLKTFRTGRIFTDYFDKIYSAGETDYQHQPAEKEHLHKISVSWSPFFEYYDNKRYSLRMKLSNAVRPLIWNHVGISPPCPTFTNPKVDRPLDISARFGLGHTRTSVVAHRKAVADKLHIRGVDTSRIPLDDYFNEMRKSKISVSPFGVGEFCYRDYESIISGAALIKPDMSHMVTWPDLYKPNETYLPHKWDLSDFDEKLDWLLSNSAKRKEIAVVAQSIYKRALSVEGLEEFAERLTAICK